MGHADRAAPLRGIARVCCCRASARASSRWPRGSIRGMSRRRTSLCITSSRRRRGTTAVLTVVREQVLPALRHGRSRPGSSTTPAFPRKASIRSASRANTADSWASRTTARSPCRCPWPLIRRACRSPSALPAGGMGERSRPANQGGGAGDPVVSNQAGDRAGSDPRRWPAGEADLLQQRSALVRKARVLGTPALVRRTGSLAQLLRQVKIEGDRQAALVIRQGQRHGDLAVILLAQLAAVLARHADGMGSFLGKAGVVEDPGSDRACRVRAGSTCSRTAVTQPHHPTAPWRRSDAGIGGLPGHAADRGGRPWLDALALARQQPAGNNCAMDRSGRRDRSPRKKHLCRLGTDLTSGIGRNNEAGGPPVYMGTKTGCYNRLCDTVRTRAVVNSRRASSI